MKNSNWVSVVTLMLTGLTVMPLILTSFTVPKKHNIDRCQCTNIYTERFSCTTINIDRSECANANVSGED